MEYLDPLVWRRILVPDTITLEKLHYVLQIAMGWTNSHLHEFEIGHARYGIPDPDWPEERPVILEKKVTLAQALTPNVRKFTYVYDFGDHWAHDIRVEKIFDNDLKVPAPICTEGANRCPPEDVGGPPGYIEFLEAINDPAHEEHENMLEWIGESFDPTIFDTDAVNRQLFKLKR